MVELIFKEMKYLSPRRVRHGSKVAIIAPASPVHSDRLQEGMDLMREVGLEPVLGPCVKNLRTQGMHSASIEERVEEINWAFKNSEISAVICALGGVGSAGLLPYLDYSAIKKSRKPFLGRSDTTALSNSMLRYSGLININGQTPSIKIDEGKSARLRQSESFLRTLGLLMSGEQWESKVFDVNPNLTQTVCGGVATGCAIGGNCDTFTRLIGTPYLPDCNGAILFIEDVHKSIEFMAREFLHLKLSGILEVISGVVIGEFQDPKNAEDRDVETVIREHFSSCGIPCVYGFPFSHGDDVSPIPIGAKCTLNANTCEVSFDFCMS